MRVDFFEFSNRSTFTGRAKGKGGVFFEKVLVSAGLEI
jgi:hypothetical protein